MKINRDIMDIKDGEIRVLGTMQEEPRHPSKTWRVVIFIAAVLAVAAAIYALIRINTLEDEPIEEVQGLYEQDEMNESEIVYIQKQYVDIEDVTISGMPIRIYTPRNLSPFLEVGPRDISDKSIFLIAQAADVRADNMEILGDFVLDGEKIARGHSKLGWCAIIGDRMSIGYGKEPAQMNEAIQRVGYFFRQYGLVSNGKYVKDTNNKKYQSVRRALCEKDGEFFIAESLEMVSLTDFAYALEAYKVDNAIALVGSHAYGFAIDENGNKHEFGDMEKNIIVESTSYIIWR